MSQPVTILPGPGGQDGHRPSARQLLGSGVGGLQKRPAGWWLGLALCGVVAALTLHTMADPDLWGHLAMGRLTLTEGFPRADPFSYTAPGASIVNHEWLSDAVAYLAFQAAGPGGLVALRLLLLVGMLSVIGLQVSRAGGAPFAIAAVAALVVVGGFPWFVTVRPQLYTFAAFTVLVAALARADDGDGRWLVCTPLLTALWVNLHGGVVAGLGVLCAWGSLRLAQVACREIGWRLPPALARGTPSRRMTWVIAGVLALHAPAALASPYGVTLWRFFAETLAVRRVEIAEWQPVALTNLGDGLGVFVLLVFGVWMASARGRARDPVHVVVLALVVLAALGARRHLALAVLAAAVLSAPFVAAAFVPRGEVALPVRSRALPLATLGVAATMLAAGLSRAGCIVIEPGTVPRTAVAYLRAAGIHGNLAVAFDWGEYVIWHLGPRVRVSIDGRRETVYPPAVLAEQMAFAYGDSQWRHGLDRYGTDLALVSPRFAVHDRLASAPDWRLAYDDATAALFVRRGSPADALLAATRPPRQAGGLCLERTG